MNKQCKLNLFDECVGYCPTGAVFSADKKYRYYLWRKWGDGKSIMFIGLNPSTANEESNDPTIRRLIGFAKHLGYDGFGMYNLFGLVSAYPEALVTNPNPVQEENTRLNDSWLINGFETHEVVVCCWGSWKIEKFNERVNTVISELKGDYWNDIQVKCFGVNKDGQPKHPLYLAKTTPLIDFIENK